MKLLISGLLLLLVYISHTEGEFSFELFLTCVSRCLPASVKPQGVGFMFYEISTLISDKSFREVEDGDVQLPMYIRW